MSWSDALLECSDPQFRCFMYCSAVVRAGMGEAVNHQYDKAFAWELDAHHYTRRYISQGTYYFSGKRIVP